MKHLLLIIAAVFAFSAARADERPQLLTTSAPPLTDSAKRFVAEVRDKVCWKLVDAGLPVLPCYNDFRTIMTAHDRRFDLMVVQEIETLRGNAAEVQRIWEELRNDHWNDLVQVVEKYEAMLPAELRTEGPPLRAASQLIIPPFVSKPPLPRPRPHTR